MTSCTVLGVNITIPPERNAYNAYRLLFHQKADQAKEKFYNLYQQNSSLEDVVNKVPDQITQCLSPILEFCVKSLMDHGIYNIDKTQFVQQYGEIQDIWGEPFLKVCDKYAEIVMDQKELDEYRVARRQGRSRWYGGGFGLSGALQGAATAGALNMISGAGHMLFNGVGKVVSSIAANMQKSKIFQDPNTYQSISDGVWEAAFALHFALIHCLSITEVDPVPLRGAISAEDSKSASAILNNARLTDNLEDCRSAMLPCKWPPIC